MHKCNYLLVGNCLLATLMLFSCTKEISESTPNAVDGANSTPAVMLPASNCKSEVFVSYNHAIDFWATLEQKWHSNGVLTNLKVTFGTTTNAFPFVPFFLPLIMDWSDISYRGNQVYITRFPQNQQLMRVTLNPNHLPEALYYNDIVFSGRYYKDTSYLYYTGTILDSMVSLVEYAFFANESANRSTAKYRFSYDVNGNLSAVDMPNLSTAQFSDGSRITFKYDLTKPVSGTMVNHNISIPLRLLESMELIKLPMHHALTDYIYASYKKGPGNTETTNTVVEQHFTDYNISPEGLVQSYVLQTSSNKFTYYCGWDCGNGSSQLKPVN